MGDGHDHGRSASRRRLAIALVLGAGYLGAEVVGGLLTGSLALLADAGHMLSDVAALALALYASWIASQPSGERWTYGRARAEVLAALAQGVALVVVALMIAREAFERMAAPPPVLGAGVLAIATGGLIVNLIALWLLNPGKHDSLNIRGAWLHVLSDALGSVGAMTAGALIWAFGWTWADPVASILISVLVVVSAWHLLREAVDVLMEAAPRNLRLERVREALLALADVESIHDLHVWTVGSGEVALSCHLVVPDDGSCAPLLSRAYATLREEFSIHHATLQIETEGQRLADCVGAHCD